MGIAISFWTSKGKWSSSGILHQWPISAAAENRPIDGNVVEIYVPYKSIIEIPNPCIIHNISTIQEYLYNFIWIFEDRVATPLMLAIRLHYLHSYSQWPNESRLNRNYTVIGFLCWYLHSIISTLAIVGQWVNTEFYLIQKLKLTKAIDYWNSNICYVCSDELKQIPNRKSTESKFNKILLCKFNTILRVNFSHVIFLAKMLKRIKFC